MRRLALLAVILFIALCSSAAKAALAPLHAGSTGQRVRDAQWLLAGNNVFRLRVYTGQITGTYNAATGQAAQRAKWRLGYPAVRVNGTFGPVIRGYLLGLEKLPADYQARRKVRLASLVTESYPLAKVGRLIGFPGQGTHSYFAAPNNWQSDHAVDIAAPVGTKVLAVGAGYVCNGCGFGPFSALLGSRFAGDRLTLVVVDARGRELDRFYYAHLTGYAAGIKPGVRVRVGQLLGYSGSANGVAHLHFAEMAGNPQTWVEHTKPALSSYGLLEWPNLAGTLAGLVLLAAGQRRRKRKQNG